MTATGIEAMVCADITQRQAQGIAKYGTTVAENPLELRQWLQHQYEELLDAAVYTRRTMSASSTPSWHVTSSPTWCGRGRGLRHD